MRYYILTPVCLVALSVSMTTAQTRTVETRTTETDVDSLTDGKVVISEKVTSLSTSEDVVQSRHMVSIDPIKFIGLFNVGYQHAITTHFTVGGMLQAPTHLTRATGWGIAAEGRYYPDGRTFRSFHLAGSISYNDIKAMRYSHTYSNGEYHYEEKIEQIAPLAIGVNVGWHWYPWRDFATEIAIGADYNFEGVEGGYGFTESTVPFLSDAKGIAPALRFTVGYAW